DARGAFQRVRGAEQTPNAVGVELTALQTDQPLFEHREEVARLDAEVAEPVLLHAARALGVCTSLASRSERLSISPAVWTVCPAPISASRVAAATFATATVTCSTAVVCCWVESSISRAAWVVVATMVPMRSRSEERRVGKGGWPRVEVFRE